MVSLRGFDWVELLGLECSDCGTTLWAIRRPDGTYSNESLVCPECDKVPESLRNHLRGHAGG